MASGSIDLLNDLFVEKEYTYTYSIGKDGVLLVSADNFNMKNLEGYVAISAKQFVSGSRYIAVSGVAAGATGTTTAMMLKEVGGAARSNITARLSVVYVKSDFYDEMNS